MVLKVLLVMVLTFVKGPSLPAVMDQWQIDAQWFLVSLLAYSRLLTANWRNMNGPSFPGHSPLKHRGAYGCQSREKFILVRVGTQAQCFPGCLTSPTEFLRLSVFLCRAGDLITLLLGLYHWLMDRAGENPWLCVGILHPIFKTLPMASQGYRTVLNSEQSSQCLPSWSTFLPLLATFSLLFIPNDLLIHQSPNLELCIHIFSVCNCFTFFLIEQVLNSILSLGLNDLSQGWL